MRSGSQFKSCKLATVIILTTLCPHVSAECPQGWEAFQDSCYVFVTQFVACLDAVILCNKFGGDLVEITSEQENTFVTNMLSTRKQRIVWIGINDVVQNGRWIYFSSARPATFFKWSVRAASAARPSGCAYLSNYGFWQEKGCSAGGHNFVCEQRK